MTDLPRPPTGTMTSSRNAIGLDAYPYIRREPPCVVHNSCVHRSFPVFLSRHWRRPATPVVNNRSPTMRGVEYGPFPISAAASLANVMGVVCSHSVWPVSAFAASTTSSRGLPYIVYNTPPSTTGDGVPFSEGALPDYFWAGGRPRVLQATGFGVEVTIRAAPLRPGNARRAASGDRLHGLRECRRRQGYRQKRPSIHVGSFRRNCCANLQGLCPDRDSIDLIDAPAFRHRVEAIGLSGIGKVCPPANPPGLRPVATTDSTRL